MKKEITFHINNMAYTISLEEELAQEILSQLTPNKNITTRELLLAFLNKTQENITMKKDIQNISDKLPPLT